MSHPGRGGADLASLDDLVEQITARARGDDEKLRAWHQAFEDHIAAPCDGFVIGEPIPVVEFAYDGHVRRGLPATCRRQAGTTHVVPLALRIYLVPLLWTYGAISCHLVSSRIALQTDWRSRWFCGSLGRRQAQRLVPAQFKLNASSQTDLRH